MGGIPIAEKPSMTMPTMYVKHRGLFDHKAFVKCIQDWFVDNKYEFHMGKYKLKAAEAEYEHRGTRDITEYVRFQISTHIWIRDIVDVEVVRDGEKVKLQEGAIQCEIYGQVIFDYGRMFGGSKFMQWLHRFYKSYIVRQTYHDVWEDDCILKMQELVARIKEILGTEAS
jgi:hypothetical protein